MCLKKHHMAKKCRSPLRCSTCNGRHHSSICFGTTQGTSPSGALPSRQTSSTQPLSSPQSTTLSMYIDMKNPVLLQTATATVYSADRPYATTVIRLILDSGSQKSYITNKLRDSLRLPRKAVASSVNQDAPLPRLVTLRFARVVFGVSSSPFLLNATIRRHVEGYRLSDPLFVERFIRSIYVDDLFVDQTVKKELLNCTLSPGSVWLKRDSTSGSSSPIRQLFKLTFLLKHHPQQRLVMAYLHMTMNPTRSPP